MAIVKVSVKKNGSLRVEAPEGSIEIVDSEGRAYDLTGKTAFSLCRCGGSAKRPFCDGSHKHNGFQSEECAPVQEATSEPQRNPSDPSGAS